MVEILTVCTGNICRSPLAEQLLRVPLEPLGATVHSAGTMGLDAAPMTTEAQKLAVGLGVPSEMAAAHRSRYLTERDLSTPDLIIAMSRDHRRRIVELAPARLRSTFTVREFARLAASVSDDEIRAAADAAGSEPSARLRAVAALVAGQRGMTPPPSDPAEDDVIDPYRRSWQTYELSAGQLSPAIAQVARAAAIALS